MPRARRRRSRRRRGRRPRRRPGGRPGEARRDGAGRRLPQVAPMLGMTGRPPGPDRALGHVQDALGDASGGGAVVHARAHGREPLLVELADEVERPQRGGDVAAQLAEHHAGARAAAVLDDPLEAVDPDHDHAGGAGARRMEGPGEPVEQRVASRQAGGGVDLGGGLRLGADEVEPARDPLHLGDVARDEGGLDGAPAAAGGEQPVLDGLGARAAHPAAVERHHALAVLGVNQRLHGASQKRVARNAGQLGDERRGVQERARGVMDRDERAHAAREQPEAAAPTGPARSRCRRQP